jgi:Protein of unknown function (DUF1826)
MMKTELLGEIMQHTPTGVSLVHDAQELSALHNPGCAGAVWQRRPLPSFQKWIDALDPTQLPSARVILRPEAVHETVQHICDSTDTSECVERDRLIGDIAALAEIFSRVMQAKWLRLRLEVVTTNACRKFHVDAVTARLICTYRGTGTQYGTAIEGRDPQRIFTVPTGTPILLRGTRWPERPPTNLRHRSPPIAGSVETRLLLVLDSIADPEEEI